VTDTAVILGLVSSERVELVQRALLGGYRGPAGVRKSFADNAETYELFTVTSDETYDAGEQVVAIGRVTVRPLGRGPEATPSAAFVFTFEHGKIFVPKTSATAVPR
jgi:ketosteroid isomerase-like protein